VLAGVRARVLSREALMRGKAAVREDPDDAAKDRADLEILSRSRPASYDHAP
jgi:hypothetical protein